MSRQPKEPPQVRRLWSFLLVKARSVLSWMLSWPMRVRAARLVRRQERMSRALAPALMEHQRLLQDSLQPVLQTMQQQLAQLVLLQDNQQQMQRVIADLLMEVLSSLQPDPAEEISRLAGQPPLPSSPPSSTS